MTKKATRPDPGALKLTATTVEEVSKPVNLARNVATNPSVHAAVAMQPWLIHVHGEIDVNELITKLNTQTDAMKRGDMGDIEAMLFAQAMTLQSMFAALSRRAASNAGAYMGATDTYLRLAFKAQSQCRSTLETLAEIKNPRPATFVRQANIANGPQQVNNGASSSAIAPPTPARDISGNPPNELITDERATNGSAMDTRSKAKTGHSNPGMEAMGTIDRP